MTDKITEIRCSHYVPNAHAVCSNMHAILHLLDCLTTLHLEGKPAMLVWKGYEGGKSCQLLPCEDDMGVVRRDITADPDSL